MPKDGIETQREECSKEAAQIGPRQKNVERGLLGDDAGQGIDDKREQQ